MILDLTPIVQALAALIGVVFTMVVIPYIRKKTNKEEQIQINEWIKIAVKAAEQIYKGSGRGEEKKKYVLDWLANHNIKIDEDAIDAMIESAVYEINNGLIPVEDAVTLLSKSEMEG